jgi:SNF2 family DNA or RNA helicase
VRTFQEDPSVPLFLISLKAGGAGLNLTAADVVFLYDPWWNEAAEAQAIARAHRMGRSGSVLARRYITALSIEEKVMRLKEHKRQLAETLLDETGGGDPALSLSDLISLLDPS